MDIIFQPPFTWNWHCSIRAIYAIITFILMMGIGATVSILIGISLVKLADLISDKATYDPYTPGGKVARFASLTGKTVVTICFAGGALLILVGIYMIAYKEVCPPPPPEIQSFTAAENIWNVPTLDLSGDVYCYTADGDTVRYSIVLED